MRLLANVFADFFFICLVCIELLLNLCRMN